MGRIGFSAEQIIGIFMPIWTETACSSFAWAWEHPPEARRLITQASKRKTIPTFDCLLFMLNSIISILFPPPIFHR